VTISEPVRYEFSEHASVSKARRELRRWLDAHDRAAIADQAELILSELVTNALLHGGGWAGVSFRVTDEGVRIDVEDRAFVGPMLGWASEGSMTGRGLSMVHALAHDFGVEAATEGKIVWAEVRPVDHALVDASRARFEHVDLTTDVPDQRRRFRVSLGDVPTSLLLDAKSHVDNLVREFTLASSGARSGHTAPVPAPLAALIEAVVTRFAEARQSIKRQALDAAHAGKSHTRLVLDLPASAADAGEAYLDALDEADAYCRAVRLLTLETPPQHRVFREWYVGELVRQLRAAALEGPLPPTQPFEERLLDEIARVAEARRSSERAARLVSVASALASAGTPSEVADAVLTAGVAALGASGGGLLLVADTERIEVPGAVGYSPELVERIRNEPLGAELPAAVALRTGEGVWVESIQERDARFPELVGLERETVAVCAVPMTLRGRHLGALRFSFAEPRLFGDDERRFVSALAAQTAQALQRAQLQHERDEISRRLQRSLLPPRLPVVPGLDVAAVYHPLGRGVEVGGDFYDVWRVGAEQWAMVIGDVSGTGPEAAAVSAQVRHTLHGLMMSGTDPVLVLPLLNEALRSSLDNGEESTFCTAVLALIDVSGDKVVVQLASGGHPSPLLRRADGSVTEVPLDGSLLGVLDEIRVTRVDVTLEPDDVLVLFTDGLLEARDGGGFFETVRAIEVVAGADGPGDAASVVSALERAVLSHTHGQLSDDVAIVALRAAP
jgi:serine phosphatase RsbU (regulator of sigma subunit)/anti-sigma regulatory factor (Ser/Thr protein kinase)